MHPETLKALKEIVDKQRLELSDCMHYGVECDEEIKSQQFRIETNWKEMEQIQTVIKEIENIIGCHGQANQESEEGPGQGREGHETASEDGQEV